MAAALLLIGLFVVDSKTVAFTVNGMETGLMVMFVAGTLYVYAAAPPSRFALLLGLMWAGLQWTRPDGVIYAAALSLGVLLFGPVLPGAGSGGNCYAATLLPLVSHWRHMPPGFSGPGRIMGHHCRIRLPLKGRSSTPVSLLPG
jgi:hypothetical protein